MRSFILVASLFMVACSASAVLEETAAIFQSFKLTHGKQYMNKEEETKRFAIFKDNLRAIEQHNALYEQGLESYKRGINQFSDQTPEEFRAFLTLHSKPTYNATKYVFKGVAVPDEIDWRTKGQVSEIKNQGNCGSCWAFSITGSTEGAYYRKSNKLVSLSEQQLVDCTTDINAGCDGGYLEQTFAYVEKFGLQSESSYPYKGVDGTCKSDSSKVVTKVDKYVTMSGNENALLEAVGTVGPVSVAIDANYLSDYSSGIFSSFWCSKRSLNHGVLVVGYGVENNKKYWIVKNSWGSDWGEDGYFKLARGSNMCGVDADTVYPVIN